jgi:triosephosphate isomerase
MRKPIIAGNWKMNKTVAEALTLVVNLRSALDAIPAVTSVVCPPFTALAPVKQALNGSHVGLGAQNLFWEEKGAFTGEVAPNMVAELCQYVILGHSERRQYFGETDASVNRKVKAALAHGLIPIICVGENLEQYEAGATDAVVRQQVNGALVGLTAEQVAGLVIAYEPIWAIGTGKAATGAAANQIINLSIRGPVADLYGEAVAQAVRVQYGGSTNAKNMVEYMQQPDIDGALVGGASLKAEDFIEMVRITANVRG